MPVASNMREISQQGRVLGVKGGGRGGVPLQLHHKHTHVVCSFPLTSDVFSPAKLRTSHKEIIS